MNLVQKLLAPLLLASLLFLGACEDTSSPYDQVQQETTQNKESSKEVSKDAHAGKDFNKFFPSDGNGYERVFTAEKKGYAEAILKKDGQEVAKLAISDTISDPTVADKFKGSSDKISGYPAAKQGKTKTSILVGDRYQVTITSKTLSESDRKEIFSQFNLSGLENLQ
jgi:hypothetical protein